MQKSTGLQCILLKWESCGLGEDESLSGALLVAAGRAALLPAAIHSAVTLPSPPGILPILKRKRDLHGKIYNKKYIHIYIKKIHTKKSRWKTHTYKKSYINQSIPQKCSSLKEKTLQFLKMKPTPKNPKPTTLQGRER